MAFASDKGRQGAAGVSTGGYDIDNSLRFNDDDSAYLSRTPSVAGNRKTWTWSCWVKRGNLSLGSQSTIFHSYGSGNQRTELTFETDGELKFQQGTSGDDGIATTTAVFRDPSAWYHIMVVADFSNGTAGNRFKLYVNGSEAANTINAAFADANGQMPTANVAIEIGGRTNNRFFDGYLAEVNFVDGQALTPADFGETGTYGEWKAIAYAGTYGTNGFYLDFSNSGSLGTDASSNSNNWTPNNLAATDQMLDSPTNNFCTLNPLNIGGGSLSEGNLTWGISSSTGLLCMSSVAFDVGSTTHKYYWEVVLNSGSCTIGIAPPELRGSDTGRAGSYSYYKGDGNKYLGASASTYGASFTSGDIIGISVGGGTIEFFKNNVSQGDAWTGLTGTFVPFISEVTCNITANFGQDSSFAGNDTTTAGPYTDGGGIGDFFYEPPTGFLALCTQNLPEPTVVPSEHFNTITYTGDGTTGRSITGVGFQPDLVWYKRRDAAWWHTLTDSVRGAPKLLSSNVTNAEVTSPDGSISSFNSDGFTANAGSTPDYGINTNGESAVAWNWKANGSGSSNTAGDINSTVSVNTDAGFSISTYTGNNTNSTVGHGLSSAPEMVIVKSRTDAQHWSVYHASAGNQYGFRLNENGAQIDYPYWNDTTPTSSVFSIGGNDFTNKSSSNFIAYCFHSVEGYSKVGSYTGNGSADGTFVHCGFAPRWLLFKTTSTDSWIMIDNERDATPGNPKGDYFWANGSNAETTVSTDRLDFTSNGFKLRQSWGSTNASGTTYIFIAFAESPFKYSTAK